MNISLAKMAEKRYEELYPLRAYGGSGLNEEEYQAYLEGRSTHCNVWIIGYITGWNDKER